MAILNEDKSKAKRLVDLAWTKEENRKTLRKFTEHALRNLTFGIIVTFDENASEHDLLGWFMAEVKTELGNNLQSCKADLEFCLEDDAEISETEQGKMQPKEKVNAFLENTCGVIGYTEDVLKAVSAAYSIVLEPDLE